MLDPGDNTTYPRALRYSPSNTVIPMADDLGRATLVRNPEYERNGLKSYVRALQKYGITPTVDGPYSGRPGEVQVSQALLREAFRSC